MIVGDRTGAGWLEGNNYANAFLDGGTEADKVSYTNADHAVSVNLAQGVAALDAVFAGGIMGGDDEVRAGSGQDVVVGYGGFETICGEGGHDHLYGGGGDDAISVSSGQDFIQGGDGDDEVWGGSDADTFHFAATDDGVDTIHDFNTSQEKLSFGTGYFEGQNLSGFDVSEALWAYAWGGVTSLYPDRTGQRLTQIAILDGVNAGVLNQKIANGTIFDIETSDVGGDGPGVWRRSFRTQCSIRGGTC